MHSQGEKIGNCILISQKLCSATSRQFF